MRKCLSDIYKLYDALIFNKYKFDDSNPENSETISI